MSEADGGLSTTGSVAPSPQTTSAPAGISPLAYAVHADQLSSTLSRGPATGAPLDASTVELLQAALRLTSSLRVQDALRRLVESACSITGAAWGTIAVQQQPDLENPLTLATGTGPSAGPSTGSATTDHKTLESLLSDAVPAGPSGSGVVIANDLSTASAFTGAIEGEGAASILSASLSVHAQVYGRLYLCDKPGGFGPGDVTTVLTLAEAAALAVENARLYQEARDREQWMAVSQELTTLLLSGAEEDDALTLIAQRVRRVARAETSALVLPSVGDTWVCEIADGEQAGSLIGTVFPADGRAISTLNHQTGMTVSSLAEAWGADDLKVPVLAQFGPALYAPMIHRGRGVGVMLLLRRPGAMPFTAKDLEIAELVAGQATMAFELADAQHAEEMATLLDERARIGRDLHDLAIQQLFATGMQVTSARDRILSGQGNGDPVEVSTVCAALESTLEAVDDSVRQIRSIVRSLRDRDEDVSVVERLRREASLARTALGYAPSLVLSVDGRDLTASDPHSADELIEAIDAAVEADIADDMVAVVREGLSNVARHAHASSVTVDVMVAGVLPGGSVLSERCQEVAPLGQVEGSLGPAAAPVVEIVCRDDGVGVPPSLTRQSGTANMAERARRNGGSFVIGPRAHSDGQRRGTCFTWRVPLDGTARG